MKKKIIVLSLVIVAIIAYYGFNKSKSSVKDSLDSNSEESEIISDEDSQNTKQVVPVQNSSNSQPPTNQVDPGETPKKPPVEEPKYPVDEKVTAGKCSRPTDEFGNKYSLISGTFQRIDEFNQIILTTSTSAGPVSVSVTPEVLTEVRALNVGTNIRLLAYVISSDSGANTPYSCLEIV